MATSMRPTKLDWGEETPTFNLEDYEGDLMVLNMGPQHPSTHGVLRLELLTDGEVVREARPHIGYLHRNFEKHAENVDYPGVIPYVDRMDYVGSMANSLAYVLTVEKLMGIQVGERVKTIRVMVAELQRIASHLLSVGTYGMDIGAYTPFLHCFRDREMVLDLFEWLCGARLLYNFNWIGGVSHDLPEGWTDRARLFVDYFEPKIDVMDELLSFNKIFTKRTASVGILPSDMAVAYAISGPNLRGSGIKWDIRKEEPYSGYETYDFDVPIGKGRFGPIGSCWDRYYVRIQEMRESCRVIKQAISKLPEGNVHEHVPKRVKPAKGEAYLRTESPRGELAFYVISDGGTIPFRVKGRSPCFVHMSVFHELARHEMIADMVAIVGSLDIVLGEIDR